MQQSNGYVILYAFLLTAICGALLAIASEGLRPFKEANKALDTKKKVLVAAGVDIEGKSGDEIDQIFDNSITSYVIDAKGAAVKGKNAADIKIDEEYSKSPESRLLPVYEYAKEKGGGAEVYVFPVFGFGLWDNISGYIGLQSDMNTINGVTFSHVGETPGLGARIADKDIQERFYKNDGAYKARQIFEGEDLVAVAMQKGEGYDYSTDIHKVDGMSGATITAQGVNKMLEEYLALYLPFIEEKKNSSVSLN